MTTLANPAPELFPLVEHLVHKHCGFSFFLLASIPSLPVLFRDVLVVSLDPSLAEHIAEAPFSERLVGKRQFGSPRLAWCGAGVASYWLGLARPAVARRPGFLAFNESVIFLNVCTPSSML
jgi:hypothetical protein